MSNNPLIVLSHSIASIVELVGKAVVTINTGRNQTLSGIHWRSGLIVTSDENLKQVENLTLTLPDNQTINATVLGRDPSTDVAILKADLTDLPVVSHGDASTLKVGHLAIALGRGNQGDIRAAMGTISVCSGAWQSQSGGQIDRLIIPDLNLYPGLAGGPLVDMSGLVVGMNTTGRRGTALTIPASTVERVVTQLLQFGRIAKGYLGIAMQPVAFPESLKSRFNLDLVGGLIIINVEPKSPAEQAGILIGDILVTIEGKPINDFRDVQAILNQSDRLGQTIAAQVIRSGQLLGLTLTIGERPT